MSKTIYWNNGRPVIRDGDRLAVMPEAFNVENWRVWARRHGLIWCWAPPPCGRSLGLPTVSTRTARRKDSRTVLAMMPVALPASCTSEQRQPLSKPRGGSSSVSTGAGIGTGAPEADASCPKSLTIPLS